MSAGGQPHIAGVDGVRCLAILAVVGFHLGVPGFSGGFLGVDVFFVISGFLITRLLVAERRRTGGIDLPDFYARRVRRLFPALMVVLAATLTWGAVFLLPFGEQQRLTTAAAAAALFIANVYYLLRFGDYFAETAEQLPLLHTWTLSVEEQFYVVWPLIVLGAWRIGGTRRAGDGGSMLGPVLMLVAVLSLVFYGWTSSRYPLVAFYTPATRAWEFALGAAVAHAGSRWNGWQWFKPEHLGALALAGIIAGVALFDERGLRPAYGAVVASVSTALLLVTLERGTDGLVARVLRSRPFTHIGLISYAWYLWHWPLLAIARATRLGQPDLVVDTALVGASLLLAHLTFTWIEEPVRRLRPWPFDRPASTLGGGAALIAAVCIGALAMRQASNLSVRDDERYRAVYNEYQYVSARGGRCSQQLLGERALDSADCRFGVAAGPPRLLIWGDSHAGRLVEGFEVVADRDALVGVQWTHSSCPPLLGVAPADVMGRPDEECRDFNAAVHAALGREAGAYSQVTSVVLAARWPLGYEAARLPGRRMPRELVGIDAGLDGLSQEQLLVSGLTATLRVLSARGARIVVVGPMPELEYSGMECALRLGDDRCDAPRERTGHQRERVLAALRRAVDSVPGAVLFDPATVLCDARRCAASSGGQLNYSDHHHLTRAGAMRVVAALTAGQGG